MANRKILVEVVTCQLIVIAIMAAITAWAWPQIPTDQPIAIHWGLSGRPDGFAPKPVALFLLPGLLVLLLVPITVRLKFDAFPENLDKSRTVLLVTLGGVYLILLAAQLLIIFTALGHALPVVQLVSEAAGILLAVIGGMLGLGMARRNATVGVRTPWTLQDDHVWDKTNRLCGWWLLATGVVVVGAAAEGNYLLVALVLLGGSLSSAVVAMAYSRRLFDQNKQR